MAKRTNTMRIALTEIHKWTMRKFSVNTATSNEFTVQMRSSASDKTNGVTLFVGTASEVENFLLGIQVGLDSRGK